MRWKNYVIFLFVVLDELIDYQNYPIKAAELSTKNRRSLGVGYIGLAHYLARHGEHYEDPNAWKLFTI
jgi:ribonucleoside-diphosphate reductase alpha chain